VPDGPVEYRRRRAGSRRATVGGRDDAVTGVEPDRLTVRTGASGRSPIRVKRHRRSRPPPSRLPLGESQVNMPPANLPGRFRNKLSRTKKQTTRLAPNGMERNVRISHESEPARPTGRRTRIHADVETPDQVVYRPDLRQWRSSQSPAPGYALLGTPLHTIIPHARMLASAWSSVADLRVALGRRDRPAARPLAPARGPNSRRRTSAPQWPSPPSSMMDSSRQTGGPLAGTVRLRSRRSTHRKDFTFPTGPPRRRVGAQR